MKYPIRAEHDTVEIAGCKQQITRYFTEHPNVLFISVTGSKQARGENKSWISLDILFKDETREQFSITANSEEVSKEFNHLFERAELFLENHNSGTLKPMEDV